MVTLLMLSGLTRRYSTNGTIFKLHKILHNVILLKQVSNFSSSTSSLDFIGELTPDVDQKQSGKWNYDNQHTIRNDSTKAVIDVGYANKTNSTHNLKDGVKTCLTKEKINNLLSIALSNKKIDDTIDILTESLASNHMISEEILHKLFLRFSENGKTDKILFLQNYCKELDPALYSRNGEYSHFLAKAHCLKGNSDKGLSLLLDIYKINVNLRTLYRQIFRELIQDSVANRSEASLVTFKRYVLQFSDRWKDHYPLVCLWHCCWSSSWFSDHNVANELMEIHEPLREIIKERATTLCLTILRSEYDDDAVVRLLQSLLKYKMMIHYAKVLQILFDYRLRNRDLRGCTEILQNCKTLGVALSSYQQGKYICMMINNEEPSPKTSKQPAVKNFKLKF